MLRGLTLIAGLALLASGAEIWSVTVRDAGRIELAVSGFRAGSVIHIARFTQGGGWRYVAAELPVEAGHDRLAIRTQAFDPGAYAAVVRDPDGMVSPAAHFVISNGRVYNAPVAAGERPMLTQGPNGGFSHWNRSANAFDIVPRGGRYVAAMRAGIAYTHDFGLGQTPASRSFGNYITIDHGDGEYSHYAHLATGRLLIRSGERVEAGQLLAVVGNSGYTHGAGGGYHVHVHVTESPAISAQSIPFRFGEGRPAAPPASSRGSVQVGQWWTEVVNIPERTGVIRVHAKPVNGDSAIEVRLISPSGQTFGPEPDAVEARAPEPGPWRVSIEGMRNGPGPIEFSLEKRIDARKPRQAR